MFYVCTIDTFTFIILHFAFYILKKETPHLNTYNFQLNRYLYKNEFDIQHKTSSI